MYFNSRPRERGFSPEYANVTYPWLFQFTPPREGLQTRLLWSISAEDYFNSRPRERGFNMKKYWDVQRFISIHAPARGASMLLPVLVVWYVFQFTPPREGLLVERLAICISLNFNSRPRERGFIAYKWKRTR